MIKSATHDLETKPCKPSKASTRNGVIPLLGRAALPEHTPVTVVVGVASVSNATSSGVGSNSEKIYELLDARYNSGLTDTAARHNEPQP